MRGHALLGTGALLLALTLSGCTSDQSADSSSASPSGGRGDVPSAAPRADPTTSSWDAGAAGRRLDALVRADGSPWSSLRTVLVSRDGRVVLARHYGGPDRPVDVSTVTVSVVGTLAGIAVRDGLLSPDDTLQRLLPAQRAAMSPVVATITLRQLLTMQSGFPADLRRATRPWFVGTPGWVGTILGTPLTGTPTQFTYTTANAELVAAALRQATGTTVRQYADRVLFGPLGIPRVRWPVGYPTGEDKAFGGLRLTGRQLLRLGALWLDTGRVPGTGRRLLDTAWVRRATADQQYEPDPGGYGYGYLWWVRDVDGHRAYSALGEGQQLLEVVPDLGLVVVALGDESADLGLDGAALQSALEAVLLPAGS